MDAPRILVLKPSSLGDIVHTLPAVHRIRLAHPGARIDWVVKPEWRPLLDGNPDLHHLLEFPRNTRHGAFGPLRFWKWTSHLASPPPDLVLDFQGLLRTGVMARRSGGKRLLGLSDAREGAHLFYHETADVSRIPHAVDRYLALASLAGAPEGPLEFPLPAGTPPAMHLPDPPFVVLHPFSRGDGKSLTPGEILRLCAALVPMPVVIVGRGHFAEKPPSGNVTDLSNRTTLPELIAVLRRAVFTVSVDSGPMHLAAALGPRVLSIHTWSDPGKVGPYPPGALVWKSGYLGPRSGWDGRSGPERPDAGELDRIAQAVACS